MAGLLIRPWRAVSLALIAGFILSGPFFLCLGSPPFDPQTSGALDRFYLLPILCLVMAAPLALVHSPPPSYPSPLMGEGRVGVRFAGVVLLTLLALLAFPVNSRRNNFLVYDYGRNLLRSLPKDAYFFMEGGDDTMYSLAYFLFAEGRRPDLGSAGDTAGLRVRDRAGLVYPSIYGFEFRTTPRDMRGRLRDIFETNLAQQAVMYYQTLRLDEIKPAGLLPVGLVQLRESAPSTLYALRSTLPNLWPFYSLRALEGPARAHYRERSLLPYYYFARGQTHSWNEQPSEASRDFKTAMLKGGDALWLRVNVAHEAGLLGKKMVEKDRPEQALELFRVASKAQADEPSYAVNICVVLDKMNKFDESLACYQETETKFSAYAELYKNKGATLIRAGRSNEARESFQRYYDLTKDVQALAWIGRIK
ncbi:MAG: tetratricopeptide repeat protein [Elusimicrobia bacterium]|nr:tetratricopeptide repeat protein [Elusimicrobiota bacterium]